MKYIFFLLSFNLCFGQIKNGKVVYSVIFNFEENKIKNKDVQNFIDVAKSGSNQISFSLKFNKNYSLYENNTRGIKNYEQEIALILSESENTCYTDLITKINYFQITENEIFRDAEFILIDTLNYNWQLSNEIKLIDNYKCYKATLKIDKNVSGTKNDLNITAWYSPEIPIAFGPNGFSGLPGLILELDYKNVKFSARSITLNSNTNFEIKKPSKGIEINRDKYIKLLKERTPDFKEFE